jgi:hypothetical protein
VALLSPIAFASGIVASGQPLGAQELLALVTTQGVLAYICFVLLLGTGLLAMRAASARESLVGLAPGGVPEDLFRRIASVRGPLAATAVVVAVVIAGGWLRYGPLPPLASLPLLSVYLLPILTFVWVYLSILVDLDRLGRLPLALDVFPQDRTLGLGALGSLASTGFGLLLVAVVPLMLVAIDEPVTLGISLVVVALTVGIFVLSMVRLHRQMSAAKDRHVAEARRLYAEAYAPIREEPNFETLAARSSALSAAQSLDERAHGLPTWPIDEGTVRFLAVVISGVVTSLVVRGLFAAIGA